MALLKLLKLLRRRHVIKSSIQGCNVRVYTLPNPSHLSLHELKHGFIELLSHLLLYVLKAKVHLSLHLSHNAIHVRSHTLQH